MNVAAAANVGVISAPAFPFGNRHRAGAAFGSLKRFKLLLRKPVPPHAFAIRTNPRPVGGAMVRFPSLRSPKLQRSRNGRKALQAVGVSADVIAASMHETQIVQRVLAAVSPGDDMIECRFKTGVRAAGHGVRLGNPMSA